MELIETKIVELEFNSTSSKTDTHVIKSKSEKFGTLVQSVNILHYIGG